MRTPSKEQSPRRHARWHARQALTRISRCTGSRAGRCEQCRQVLIEKTSRPAAAAPHSSPTHLRLLHKALHLACVIHHHHAVLGWVRHLDWHWVNSSGGGEGGGGEGRSSTLCIAATPEGLDTSSAFHSGWVGKQASKGWWVGRRGGGPSRPPRGSPRRLAHLGHQDGALCARGLVVLQQLFHGVVAHHVAARVGWGGVGCGCGWGGGVGWVGGGGGGGVCGRALLYRRAARLSQQF